MPCKQIRTHILYFVAVPFHSFPFLGLYTFATSRLLFFSVVQKRTYLTNLSACLRLTYYIDLQQVARNLPWKWTTHCFVPLPLSLSQTSKNEWKYITNNVISSRLHSSLLIIILDFISMPNYSFVTDAYVCIRVQTHA